MFYRPRLSNGELVSLSWSLRTVRTLNHVYWPLEKNASLCARTFERVAWILGFLVFAQHNEAEFRYIYENVQNIDVMLAGIPTYLVLCETELRGFLVGLSKDKFRRLLEHFYSRVYVEQSKEPKAYSHIQRQLWPTTIYSALYFTALMTFFIIPILNVINNRKETLYKMSFAFDYTPNYIYIPLTLSSMYAGLIVVTIVYGDINVVSEIILHLNERYLLLRRDLQTATERLLEHSDANEIAKDFQREVISIVKRNAQLNLFAAELQHVYTFRIFVLFAFSAALLCTLCFKVYTNPAEGYTYALWACAKILELLAIGEVGSTLIATTDIAGSMYYESQWELIISRSTDTRENVRLMKLILLTIELNQKSISLMGLNFFSLSLTAVMKILQGAGSYFTCLIALPKTAVVDTAGDYPESVPLPAPCPPTTPPYQRLTKALQCDPRCGHEVTIGRRIGLYRFCGDIGRGNFSKVKLAVHQLTRDKVAIKVVDRGGLDAKALRMLSSEIATLECVHHPNILRLFEVIETLGRVYLVTEWIRGGELYNHITQGGPLREIHAAPLYKQLLLAVKHMHSLGYVHRDIKAENVLLLSEDRLKLADFGFSTQLINGANQKLDTFCGSPPYAAPELFSDDHYIGAPVDVWALGILLYFMVVGNMPFRAPTIPGLKGAILKGDYLLPGQLSLPCIRLIQRILVHIPARRPTIDDMLGSQFVTCPKLSAELMQHEINMRSKPMKRSGAFWVRSKSRRIRKTYSLRERYMEVTNKPPISMNTKKNDGFFVDNFLHPIEVNRDLPPELNKEPSRNNTPKRSFFCGTLKKKVSPMEIEKEKQIVANGNGCEKRQWNADTTIDCPLFKNYDAETGKFIMLPTNSEDLSKLSGLEFEARQLLEELGVTTEMLRAALQNGPRSDIIGAYRIVINRLQKQSWLARKHVELALQEMPKSEKKIERSCCIL